MSGVEGPEDLLFYKLKDLITEQSEGEWTDEQIVTDAHTFAKALRPVSTPPATPIAGGFGPRPQEAVVPTEPVADRWADLERLVKAATPGPWLNASGEWEIYGNDGDNKVAHAFLRADQSFIAAANPATILELIAAARTATQ